MRKLFYLVGFSLITLQFSCSKETVNNESKKDYSISNIISNFSNQYAKFEDFNSIKTFLEDFYKMEESAKKVLIKSLPYKTRSKHFEQQYLKIETFKNSKDASSFIYNNPNFIVSKTSSGSEIALEKAKTYHLLYPFLNKDGIIKIGDEFQKYFLEYVVSSKEYNKLKNVYSLKEAEENNLKPLKVVTLLNSNNLNQRSNEINITKFKEKIYDPSNCINDRRIEVENGVFDNIISFGGLTTHIIEFVFEARPYKKGIVCIWYPYSTNVKYSSPLILDHNLNKKK
jgi:hypothetical protein